MAPTCIDAFCGAGGMSLGLKSAGFRPILAFDIDRQAVETFQRNLQTPAIVRDVQSLSRRDLLGTGAQGRSLDLIAGGPPCQGFSKQKRGAHLGDRRNDLVLEFVRLVRELKPRAFLFENVAIFGQKRGRRFFRLMQRELLDFVLCASFVNAADFGLAQTRQRFIVIGYRRDLGVAPRIPRPRRSWKTVGEVIGNLPEPPEDYTDHPLYPNHQRARVTPINLSRVFDCCSTASHFLGDGTEIKAHPALRRTPPKCAH